MTCANCHSPKGPPAAVAGKDYSGGLRLDEPPFKVTAPNITPDKETGIGNWTDDQIKTMLLTGKNPNGVQEAEIMPTAFYPILTPGDLERASSPICAASPPVKNKVPDPIYKIALPHHVFPGAEKPYAQADLNDKLKRGFYLVTIGHCMECHTPFAPGGGPRLRELARQGRPRIPRPLGRVEVAQHHLAARPPASATGPTPRSRPRSPRASGRTARRSRARWATSTTPR